LTRTTGNTTALVPAGPEDSPWIEALQRGILAEALAGIPEPQLGPLLELQLRSQDQQYRRDWPGASSFLIMAGANRVGRILLHEGAQRDHLVDISILHEFRNAGIGTQALQLLISRAESRSNDLCLRVAASNPALALYQRLGFEIVADAGVYLEMKRRSGSI
jgi:ribosomal protein S18 acetylase RimI-like enzyme